MKILIVEPGKHPREADIPHTPEAMQEVVGGYCHAIYPWEDPCALISDDEGLLKNYKLNRMICDGLAIAGTFFICGLSGEHFADLPDSLMEKYRRRFWHPELFVTVKINGKKTLRSIPLTKEGEA